MICQHCREMLPRYLRILSDQDNDIRLAIAEPITQPQMRVLSVSEQIAV
jgi:hypothetical protein